MRVPIEKHTRIAELFASKFEKRYARLVDEGWHETLAADLAESYASGFVEGWFEGYVIGQRESIRETLFDTSRAKSGSVPTETYRLIEGASDEVLEAMLESGWEALGLDSSSPRPD